ncbi:MAG: tetratricopeptide repeat protein [Gemmatimonadetes bacterium]|nr:tetratricopeptide repeat protein [Gemmatimonadota bacterium]
MSYPENVRKIRSFPGFLCVLVLVVIVWCAASARADTLSPGEVDAVYIRTTKSDDPDSIRVAIGKLEGALNAYPNPALLRVRIGMLYLKAKDAQRARARFRDALVQDSTLVAARYGLGRVYLDLMNNPRRALKNLERAVRVDSTYVDAHHLMGRAYMKLRKNEEVLASVRTALRHDPDHAPSYMLLADYYLTRGNTPEAIRNFQEFLSREPDDEESAFDFAMHLLEIERYDEVLQLAALMGLERGLPLEAQVLAAWGDHEEALGAFERYITLLPPKLRTAYYDISNVGGPDDVQAYRNTPPEDREAFLRGFWLKRDPFQTSGGAMRRVEHYRRVWRAMTLYGEIAWPFDARGRVFVRYGEPDWKSNWRQINAQVPIKVQRVQEKLAFQLYGRRGMDMNFIGPVYPIRSDRTVEKALSQTEWRTNSKPLGGPEEIDVGLTHYKPVTTSMDYSKVGWEVWIYADIENGLEVVFTDELYSGIYDFAPEPTPDGYDLGELAMQRQGPMRRLMTRLPNLAPGARVARISKDLPERYNLSHLNPMEFYYEALTFRGRNGEADLQLNLGLPLDNVLVAGDRDTTVTLDRRIALIENRTEEVRKTRDRLDLRISPSRRGAGLLAVDRVDLTAPPGAYRLALQMSRLNANRLQAYHQEVEVPDYDSGQLLLSDLQVAYRVVEAGPESDPKSVRGRWQIDAAPSRAFRSGEPVYVYFEIYNLTRDSFGNARYEVGYEVRHGRKKLKTLARKGSGEMISVSYRQVGASPDESDYVELDLRKARPGRYRVKMTVKDLVSGGQTVREGRFQILEK